MAGHGQNDRGSLNLEQALIFATLALVVPFLILPALAVFQVGVASLAGSGTVEAAARGAWYGLWLPAGILAFSAFFLGVGTLRGRGRAEGHKEPRWVIALGSLSSLVGLAVVGVVTARIANGNPSAGEAGFWGAVLRLVVPYVVSLFVATPFLVKKSAKDAAAKAADAAAVVPEGEDSGRPQEDEGPAGR